MALSGIILASAIDFLIIRLPTSGRGFRGFPPTSMSRKPMRRPVAGLGDSARELASGPSLSGRWRQPPASFYLSRFCRPARRRPPTSFEIVEGAHLRPEHMDDDVAGIDQHPVAVLLPSTRMPFRPALLRPSTARRDRGDMAVRVFVRWSQPWRRRSRSCREIDGDGGPRFISSRRARIRRRVS